jgi:hypothetical protein
MVAPLAPGMLVTFAPIRVAEALASAKPKDALRTLFEEEVAELRKMEDEGLVAKGTSADSHPIRTIFRLELTPGVPPVLQFACAKERLQYHELTAGEKAKINAIGDGAAPSISISIQPWAAAKPAAPALPAPKEIDSNDVFTIKR